MLIRLSILAFLFAVSGELHGQDWPRFRDGQGNGKSNETNLLLSCPESGPEPIWQAKHVRQDYSSVAVFGEFFYTTSDWDEAQRLNSIHKTVGTAVSSTKIVSANNREVQNLSAFAKSYGYVRFFYPNVTTKDFDWDAFLVYGIQKLREIETDNELRIALSDLFKPIAPYVVFSNNECHELEIKPISNGDSITFWQHRSLSIGENTGAKIDGNNIKILVTTPFDSSKIIESNSPFLKDNVQFQHIDYRNSDRYQNPGNYAYLYDSELSYKYVLDKQPDPSSPFSYCLGSNLWITTPLALSSQEAEHNSQKSELKKFSEELKEFYENAIFRDDDLWFADFVLTWNSIHHLYAYRKRSEKIFDFSSSKQLDLGLELISSATDKKRTSLRAVRNYVSLFNDAHASVFRARTLGNANQSDNEPSRERSWLPFYRIYSQGKVYVLRSFDPKIKNGDEILEINSTNVSVLIDGAVNRGVRSPQSNLLNAVGSIGYFVNASIAVVKLRRGDEILTLEVNTIPAPAEEYFEHIKNPFGHEPFEFPNPKTIYVNPSLVTRADIREKFDEILEAEHLIFDLRDYPNFNSLKDIFGHLPVENGLRKGLILSNPINMYPNQEYQYHIWQSSLSIPERPFIDANISVLIGSSIPAATHSRGETYASYFKSAGATLIGDSNSTGASGGTDYFTTPGMIKITLTTSFTVRSNGEEMQSIGIAPDILVVQTPEGLKEGSDLVFGAALKRTQQE